MSQLSPHLSLHRFASLRHACVIRPLLPYTQVSFALSPHCLSLHRFDGDLADPRVGLIPFPVRSPSLSQIDDGISGFVF